MFPIIKILYKYIVHFSDETKSPNRNLHWLFAWYESASRKDLYRFFDFCFAIRLIRVNKFQSFLLVIVRSKSVVIYLLQHTKFKAVFCLVQSRHENPVSLYTFNIFKIYINYSARVRWTHLNANTYTYICFRHICTPLSKFHSISTEIFIYIVTLKDDLLIFLIIYYINKYNINKSKT